MKYLLLTCVLVLLKFIESDAILCYQCADSTNAKDRARCTNHIRSMAHERYRLETEGGEVPSDKFEFLKNCSNYSGTDGKEFKFCKIETIQAFGQINAFIRDCSDGKSFAKLNVSRLDNLKADNQTTCGYASLQNANHCVQLCDSEDFCNGPFSDGNMCLASLTIALISVFVSRITNVMSKL